MPTVKKDMTAKVQKRVDQVLNRRIELIQTVYRTICLSKKNYNIKYLYSLFTDQNISKIMVKDSLNLLRKFNLIDYDSRMQVKLKNTIDIQSLDQRIRNHDNSKIIKRGTGLLRTSIENKIEIIETLKLRSQRNKNPNEQQLLNYVIYLHEKSITDGTYKVQWQNYKVHLLNLIAKIEIKNQDKLQYFFVSNVPGYIKQSFNFEKMQCSSAVNTTYKTKLSYLERENTELKQLLLTAKNNIAEAMKLIFEIKESNILEKLHNVHYDICKVENKC